MVRGGRAEVSPLTTAEQAICDHIGPELRRRGLLFVGIDVIGDKITEINVTSPTGLRAIRKLGGPDLAAAIWDAIAARRAALR
jgi:glutathione synthase